MQNHLLHWLYSLNRFGMKLGLDVMRQLMQLLGDPQQQFPCIHVTGTNGKGSTTAFIAQILLEAGFKVGRYTSPHLVKFNERITINNRPISDRSLIALIQNIKSKSQTAKLRPTFFEFTTALAFQYFAEQKVDIAVVEVGMGGRLDATNVVHPLVSVSTNIEYDHQKHLGSTLLQIAREKAGIIKENSILVTAEKRKKNLQLFQKICKRAKTKMIRVNGRFRIMDANLNGQTFKTKDGLFTVALLGDYQPLNALTAVTVIRTLRKYGWLISDSTIQKALLKTEWPWRLQVIAKKPLTIVDGSHNVAGFRYVQRFLRRLPHQKKILIIGISKDKDIPKMIPLIAPFFQTIIVTKSNFKPAPIKTLLRYIPQNKKVITTSSLSTSRRQLH
ncbi:bifunctional folylpolyglutamate synthase/dihydrofolate synthase [Candidatus Woesearchaeota archaeon]|nr:bifunctional folylpolyglutamate synthase/dihydrofolate synthase [Candidatus Woesearchaeota archaeon]